MSKFLASVGPVGKILQFGPNLDQDYKTLYLMIICKDFSNLVILVWWGTIDWQKSIPYPLSNNNNNKKHTLGQFVQKLCNFVACDPL